MQRNGSFLASIPPVTLNLIIINFLVWAATTFIPALTNPVINFCGLHYWGGSDFNAAQFITYMFLHDTHNIAHVFFNMFSLYMFGRILENVWGGKRFLFYYITTGIGAALVQEVVWTFTWENEFYRALAAVNPGVTIAELKTQISQMIVNGNEEWLNNIALYKNNMTTIGASGAVFGILLAFGMLFPNIPLYLFFIPVPIKAKYFVIGYGVIELFFGITHTMGDVAHYAHLGGMLFGIILILYWRKKGIGTGSGGMY